MNSRRRMLVAIAALVAPHDVTAGGLDRIVGALSGRQRASIITVLFVDQSASINAEDATVYQQAFAALSDATNAGDRFVIGAISDRPIGQFVPAIDRSVQRKGIALDDREAAAKAKQEVQSEFTRTLTPGKRVQSSHILDAVSASAEIMANAPQKRKRLVLLTDGVEESTSTNFARSSLDARAADQIIERRRLAGLIPTLNGVDVWIIGAGGNNEEKYSQLRGFWTAYIAATGARLVYYGRTAPEVQ